MKSLLFRFSYGAISFFTCLLIINLAIVSCCKNEDIPLTFVKSIWKFALHKNGQQHNSIIDANLVFDNKIILATTDGPDNKFITCLNINNGAEMWKWNDIYQPPTEYFDITYFTNFDQLFFYQVGTRSYCINLSDGSTHFKERGTISYDSRFPSFKSIAFLLGDMVDTLTGNTVNGMYKMDIKNGLIVPFLLPPFDSTFLYHFQSGTHGFSNIAISNDGNYLVTAYAYLDSNNNVISKLGLFNIIENKWNYNNIKLSDNPKWNSSVYRIPIIYDDKIYINIGNAIACYNFWTGAKIWQRDFQAGFLFSGFIVEDGQLLANCEDGIFYCIDPNTGNVKWHTEGAGTSSPLRYLNGIVYFSGGSTGRIHAIDTNTGEYVWRLEPDKYDNASDFKPDIYVAAGEIGDKGKVIICTPEKAYCLPAYQ